MTNSLRALLTGAIDYAGTFPPALLSFEHSLANYQKYLSAPTAWLLGRFVCPVARLDSLSRAFSESETAARLRQHREFVDPDVRLMLQVRAGNVAAFEELVTRHQDRLVSRFEEWGSTRTQAEDLAQEVFLRVDRARKIYVPSEPFETWLFTIAKNVAKATKRGLVGCEGVNLYPGDERVTVAIPASESKQDWLVSIRAAFSAMKLLPIGMIDSVEVSWPLELALGQADPTEAFFGFTMLMAVESKLRGLTIFIELPPATALGDIRAWRSILVAAVAGLDRYNAFAAKNEEFPSACLKYRTGGVQPDKIPYTAELTAMICVCRDSGMKWKATAGLHHALRHFDADLGTRMHGFLNVFTATVLADARNLNETLVEAILEDQDASHFRFTDEGLSYCDLTATVAEITVARQRGLQSFGSCSFEEPVSDLRALGLL